MKKMEYNDWLEKAKSKHGDKYIYNELTKEAFNGSHSKVPILCRKHGIFYIEARRHINEGYGCNKCAIENRAEKNKLSFKEFVEKARKIHGEQYEYIEYLGAKTPSKILCKKHGIFHQLPNDHLSGKGCPFCRLSHLEREIKIALETHDIKYDYRKHFEWLGKQEIDFFLPEYNIGIECQGKQHFGFGGWSDKYDHSKQISLDETKNRLAFENKIDLVYFIDKTIVDKFYPDFYKKEKCFMDKDELINYIKNNKSGS